MTADGVDLFLDMVCYLGYAWCAARFLTRHLGGGPSEGRLFCGLFFCGHAAIALAAEKEVCGISYILYAICRHVLTIGLAMAVFRAEREKKLLAAVLLMVLTSLLWNFGGSFLCCVGLLLGHVGGGRGWAVTGMGVWVDRAIDLSTCAVGMLGVERASGPLASVFVDKRKSWYLSLTVPLASVLLLTDLVNQAASNGIMVHSWGGHALYEEQLFSHSAMCIFTGLELAAAGSFVFGLEQIFREERTREQYRSQVLYYQMMEEQYGQMERLRHDMKNHLLALENLVQGRQWEQAGSYLRALTKAGSVGAGEEATGSLVMDALLYHKKRLAAARGIVWQCDVRLPADCPVKDMDLCILVGNSLDNAVEACRRLQEETAASGEEKGDAPFIRVYMGAVKKCLLLEVQNSTDLTDVQETGRSRKSESGLHGLGLSNIRAVAAAHNGTVHMEVEEGVFTLSVLLPMGQAGSGH